MATPGNSASESTANIISVPPFIIPWDIALGNGAIVGEFNVTQYRYYDFQIAMRQKEGTRREITTKELVEFAGRGTSEWVTKESADSDNPVVAPANIAADSERFQRDIREGKYVVRGQKLGVMIPVHLIVEKAGVEPAYAVLYDRTIETWNIEGGSKDGLLRHIDSVKLRAGKYRFKITTTQAILVPSYIQTSLRVTFRPEMRILESDE